MPSRHQPRLTCRTRPGTAVRWQTKPPLNPERFKRYADGVVRLHTTNCLRRRVRDEQRSAVWRQRWELRLGTTPRPGGSTAPSGILGTASTESSRRTRGRATRSWLAGFERNSNSGPPSATGDTVLHGHGHRHRKSLIGLEDDDPWVVRRIGYHVEVRDGGLLWSRRVVRDVEDHYDVLHSGW